MEFLLKYYLVSIIKSCYQLYKFTILKQSKNIYVYKNRILN